MLYDVLLIAILVVSVIRGYKKGAARTILSAVAILVSAFLAIMLSRFISVLVYDAFFRGPLEAKIESALQASVVEEFTTAAGNVISAIPSVVLGAMSFFGLPRSSFESYCETTLAEEGAGASAVITDKLSPVITGLISVVIAFILFIILTFILNLLVKPISKIFKLPLIRTPNSVLGGVLGLIKGFVIVLLLSMLIKLAMPLIPSEWAFLNNESIENSYIFSFIYDGGLLRAIQQFTYRID